MTYEGSAHRTPEEQAEVAADLRAQAERRDRKAKAKRRENIEDLLVVIVVALSALVIGARVERVYLHDHEPVECASEDEMAVELTEDGYGHLAGERACVHIDALEVSGD